MDGWFIIPSQAFCLLFIVRNKFYSIRNIQNNGAQVIKSNNAAINNICIWIRSVIDIHKLLFSFRTLFPSQSNTCTNYGIHTWKIFMNV